MRWIACMVGGGLMMMLRRRYGNGFVAVCLLAMGIVIGVGVRFALRRGGQVPAAGVSWGSDGPLGRWLQHDDVVPTTRARELQSSSKTPGEGLAGCLAALRRSSATSWAMGRALNRVPTHRATSPMHVVESAGHLVGRCCPHCLRRRPPA